MKALVIDDSSTVRSIITKMLTAWGMQTLQAENGLDAFTKLTDNQDVEIAFVDWNMPVMSGIQFVKKVRSEPKYKNIKLVMVTTETEMPQLTVAFEAGVDEYIMKPFTKEIFREKLTLMGVQGVENV